jgi:organic hydroperoxide reductase OsmC/OhrA
VRTALSEVLYTAHAHVTGGRDGNAKTAEQLVRDAHEVCPYSNATRGNIDVTLLIHGEPI